MSSPPFNNLSLSLLLLGPFRLGTGDGGVRRQVYGVEGPTARVSLAAAGPDDEGVDCTVRSTRSST
jgi:hypothetical protein